MPLYKYKATQLDGKTVRGQMQAANKLALREQLISQDLYLSVCTEFDQAVSIKRFNARQLSDFCRELGAMLGAGIPLVRALSIMAKRDIPERIKEVYNRLYRSLRQGSMLSEAMEAQNGVFPDLLISMYKASEASGAMEETSVKMAVHYDKSYKLSKKVKNAMTYPIILAVVTFIVLLAVFLVILPRFFSLFESLDTPLPGITQFMLNLSRGLQENWFFVLLGILLLLLILKLLCQIPAVRLNLDRMKLKIPVVGKLLKIIYTARFCRTLSSCYAAGISIVSALRNTKDTVGNAYIASQFPDMIRSVRSGNSLSSAVAAVDGFDSKLAASIQIGEETGKLFDMLESTADAFDYDSEMALNRLTTLVEPVMIVLMALIIGTVIISVMLPLTTLYDAIGASA